MSKPNFDYNSNFNPKAGIGSVRFGADAPVLEVELNELQQIQDKAREDLIRSSIPSGFTKPVVLDLEHQNSTSNNLIVAQDAEAYVNGMRIVIPKSTIIDIGESPSDTTREDLVFLEVWKEELNGTSVLAGYGGDGQPATTNTMIDPRVGTETSRRIVNRWRIRHIAGLDFSYEGHVSTVANCPDTYIGWNNDTVFSKAYAKGANEDLAMPTSILGQEIFRSANSDWITPQGFNDPTLWIAGLRGDAKSLARYKTVDGLVYAIPMFRLHRRPNSGFIAGDFTNISPIANTAKVAKLLESTKKVSTGTGELDLRIEGKMFYNLLPDRESYDDGHTGWDKPTNSGYISADQANIPFDASMLSPNTQYTLVFDAFIQDINTLRGKILYMDMFPDSFPDIKWFELTDTRTRYAVNFTTPSDLTGLTSLRFYSGENTNILLIKEVMLFEGTYTVETAPKSFFKGVSAVGDNVLTLERYISWEASITNGTAQDIIAQFPYKLNDPYLHVVPVDDKGREVLSGDIAFAVNQNGNNLGWNAVNGSLRIDDYWKIDSIRVWCNNVAPTCKIKGFNIYSGSNILVSASNLDNTKESVQELRAKEPIRSLYNSKDLAFGDGRIVRRVKKGVLDGTEDWVNYVLTSKDGKYSIFQLKMNDMARTRIMSKLAYIDVLSDEHSTTINREFLGVYKGANSTGDWIYLCIANSKLAHPYVPDLKEYLKSKPITFYYEVSNTIMYPKLPNGVEDWDSYNGTIIKNIGVISKPKDLDWHFDAGVTQTASCMRICVEVPDKKNIGNNNQIGNDVYCANIPTLRQSQNEIRIPRIWSWYGSSIYIDVTAEMIGSNFSSDSDSVKLEKFKQWLGYQGEIYYQKAIPTIQEYPMDYAEVVGNMLLDNETYNISVQGTTQPRVTLNYKNDLSLDLCKGKNLVSINNAIPPTSIEIEGQSTTGRNVEVDLAEDISKAPITVKGRTLNNLINFDKFFTNFYKVNGVIVSCPDGDTRPWDAIAGLSDLLEPNQEYTLIVRNMGTCDATLQYKYKQDMAPVSVGVNAKKMFRTSFTINSDKYFAMKFYNANAEAKFCVSLFKGNMPLIDDFFIGLKSLGESEYNYLDASQISVGYIGNSDGKTYTVPSFDDGTRIAIMPCEPNTTYTITREIITDRFVIGTTAQKPTNGMNVTKLSEINDFSSTVTTPMDAKYLLVYLTMNIANKPYGKVSINKDSYVARGSQHGRYTVFSESHCKNILDLNSKFIDSNATHRLIDNGIEVTTKENQIWCYSYTKIIVEPNTDYYLSFNFETQVADVGWIAIRNLRDMLIKDFGLHEGVFNSGDNTELVVQFYAGLGDAVVNTVKYTNVQIEKGTEKTPFEQYLGGSRFISFDEPIKSLPDGTCDIVTSSQGKTEINRKVNKAILDNNSWWKDLETDGTYTKMSIQYFEGMKYGCSILCDQLLQMTDIGGVQKQCEYIATTTNPYYSIVVCLKAPDRDAFLNRLKQKPLTIYFEKDTPDIRVLDNNFDSNLSYEVNLCIPDSTPTEATSGIDCGYFRVTDSTLIGEWKTNEIIECTYNYPYGNINDLVEKPLTTDFGYKDETQYRFKLLKLLPNNKCLIQNVGKPNPSANRSFTLHPSVSTKMNMNSIVDLQKKVSLVGNDYNTVLEKEICKHLY